MSKNEKQKTRSWDKCRFLINVCFMLLLVQSTVYAQDKKISLTCKDEPLATVLRKVEIETGYKMNFNYDLLSTYKVTAQIKQKTAQEAVDILIKDFPLQKTVNGKFIQIYPIKEKKEKQKANTPKIIKGVIVESDDSPLPGATIREIGTKNGTSSDLNGNFTLQLEKESSELLISYIGKDDRKQKVNDQTFIKIVLQDNVFCLDNIVVTGYQSIKKENATGSYQKITSKDMEQRYTSDIISNLEGKIPGLVSYKNGITDGGESSLSIRGISSLKARTNPLIVVDGLPIEGSIESINPYEIQSITVLKDAAAASIYGARASNGVIVIVTKKADSEKLNINFNADFTINNKISYDNFNWCNASEDIQLQQNNFAYAVNNPKIYEILKNEYARKGRLMNPITQLMIKHHMGEISDDIYNKTVSKWKNNNYRKDWSDLILHNKLLQQYNISVHSKGKYLNSNIVINYKDDNTDTKNQYNKILSLSYTGSCKINKWLDIDCGLFINDEQNKEITNLFGYNRITSYSPYESLYNDDGTFAINKAAVPLDEPSLSNPSLGLKPEGYRLADEMNLNTSRQKKTYKRNYVHANVNITPDLQLNALFQQENITAKTRTYYRPESYDMRHLYNLFTSGKKHYIPEGGLLKVRSDDNNYYTFRAQANYNKRFNEKHYIEAVSGFEFRQTHSTFDASDVYSYDEQTLTNNMEKINFYDVQNLASSDLGVNFPPSASYEINKIASASDILHRYYSYYITGNYSYDSRYSGSLSYRVDNTDLFGADPKFRSRPLWSTGLSWNIQNEPFMKSIKWIDLLKLRGSYGLTGNIDSSVSSYLTASIYTSKVTSDRVANLNTPPNEQLRWEKTASWNSGLDYSFLKNRLYGSMDFYYRYSTDLLNLTDLDVTTGWKSLTCNNSKVVNKGVELQTTGLIIMPQKEGDLSVTASLSIAYNKNKIKEIAHSPNSGYSALSSFHEGDPIHSLYSFQFAGLAIDKNGDQQVTWKKQNGSIVDTDLSSSDFRPEDVVFSGSIDPTITASFSPIISYKGVTLTAIFNFYGGHYFRATANEWFYGAGAYTGYTTLLKSNLKYWESPDKTKYIANGYAAQNMRMRSSNLQYIDQNVDHADYMKLRNIILGYTFPRVMCQKLGVKDLRIRMQVNNVSTWVRNSSGVDPEAVNPYTGKAINKAPQSYTFSLSINL